MPSDVGIYLHKNMRDPSLKINKNIVMRTMVPSDVGIYLHKNMRDPSLNIEKKIVMRKWCNLMQEYICTKIC